MPEREGKPPDSGGARSKPFGEVGLIVLESKGSAHRLLERANEVIPLSLGLQLKGMSLRIRLIRVFERGYGAASQVADGPDDPHPRLRRGLWPALGRFGACLPLGRRVDTQGLSRFRRGA